MAVGRWGNMIIIDVAFGEGKAKSLNLKRQMHSAKKNGHRRPISQGEGM